MYIVKLGVFTGKSGGIQVQGEVDKLGSFLHKISSPIVQWLKALNEQDQPESRMQNAEKSL